MSESRAVSQQRYKPITLYFDISNKEHRILLDMIEENAQKNKKSSYVISVLQAALRNKPTTIISDQMCADIASRIAKELKPQLSFVQAEEPSETSEENTLEKKLIEKMDEDTGLCYEF